MNAICHRPLPALLRGEHIRVQVNAQKLAYASDNSLRLLHQLLEPQAVLALCGDVLQKIEYVLMADRPDQLCQCSGRETGFISEDLIQPCFLKRTDHGIRMA